MGAADTVPGISGGTIALIMGHYSRLVTAISHFDVKLVGLLSKRQFAAGSEPHRFSFPRRPRRRHPGWHCGPLRADALPARCPFARDTRRVSRTAGGESLGGRSVCRSLVAVAHRRLRRRHRRRRSDLVASDRARQHEFAVSLPCRFGGDLRDDPAGNQRRLRVAGVGRVSPDHRTGQEPGEVAVHHGRLGADRGVRLWMRVRSAHVLATAAATLGASTGPDDGGA